MKIISGQPALERPVFIASVPNPDRAAVVAVSSNCAFEGTVGEYEKDSEPWRDVIMKKVRGLQCEDREGRSEMVLVKSMISVGENNFWLSLGF